MRAVLLTVSLCKKQKSICVNQRLLYIVLKNDIYITYNIFQYFHCLMIMESLDETLAKLI